MNYLLMLNMDHSGLSRLLIALAWILLLNAMTLQLGDLGPS